MITHGGLDLTFSYRPQDLVIVSPDGLIPRIHTYLASNLRRLMHDR